MQEWINGADFAPEYLYEVGKEIKTYTAEQILSSVAEPPCEYKKPKES